MHYRGKYSRRHTYTEIGTNMYHTRWQIQHQVSIKRRYYLLKSPGQDLQHRPGRRTGSLHVSSGHSFLMLRQ